MDRRQIKTKKAIFDAFTVLLNKKSYDKIIVQEVIDEANIGRSTFYSHFKTKDELLKEICEKLFMHIFSDTLMIEKTHDFSNEKKNIETIAKHIFYHIRDDKYNMINILKCESSEIFIQYFKEHLKELVTKYILNDKRMENIDIPVNFLINHISTTFVNTIQWWIKNKMKQTPEEISRYFIKVISFEV